MGNAPSHVHIPHQVVLGRTEQQLARDSLASVSSFHDELHQARDTAAAAVQILDSRVERTLAEASSLVTGSLQEGTAAVDRSVAALTNSLATNTTLVGDHVDRSVSLITATVERNVTQATDTMTSVSNNVNDTIRQASASVTDTGTALNETISAATRQGGQAAANAAKVLKPVVQATAAFVLVNAATTAVRTGIEVSNVGSQRESARLENAAKRNFVKQSTIDLASAISGTCARTFYTGAKQTIMNQRSMHTGIAIYCNDSSFLCNWRTAHAVDRDLQEHTQHGPLLTSTNLACLFREIDDNLERELQPFYIFACTSDGFSASCVLRLPPITFPRRMWPWCRFYGFVTDGKPHIAFSALSRLDYEGQEVTVLDLIKPSAEDGKKARIRRMFADTCFWSLGYDLQGTYLPSFGSRLKGFLSPIGGGGAGAAAAEWGTVKTVGVGWIKYTTGVCISGAALPTVFTGAGVYAGGKTVAHVWEARSVYFIGQDLDLVNELTRKRWSAVL